MSRCISNLGSPLGTAVAGTILVSSLTNRSYAASMIVLAVIGIVGSERPSSRPPRGLSVRALGHSSVSFTMDTYQHLMPTMQDAATRAIEEAIGGTVAAGLDDA